jgi:hypothetical protein
MIPEAGPSLRTPLFMTMVVEIRGSAETRIA